MAKEKDHQLETTDIYILTVVSPHRHLMMSARISHLGMFNFFSIPPQINTIKNWEYTSAFHILVCGRSSP